MKSVLFVRHAKSDWNSPTFRDHDRPLNERGHRDAPAMAKRLLDKGIELDALISSTALRAQTTASHFQEIFKESKLPLIEVPSLYHAYPPAFYEAISQFDSSFTKVAIFSHNPGITDMVNSLEVAHVDDMPTCAIFGVHVDTDNWQGFKKATKRFWLYDYPKL